MNTNREKFNSDYRVFCWLWLVMGILGMVFVACPQIVSERNMESVSEVIVFLMFLASGALLLRGQRGGVYLILSGIALKCITLFLAEGWEGFTPKVLVTLVLVLLLLAIMLLQKKDGVPAWRVLFRKADVEK